jgi:hypothetical protein
VAAKEIAVKKYVVKLSAEERGRLNALIQSGKHPARKLTRARILLKADAGIALRLPHMASCGGSVVRLADGAGRDHRGVTCGA